MGALYAMESFSKKGSMPLSHSKASRLKHAFHPMMGVIALCFGAIVLLAGCGGGGGNSGSTKLLQGNAAHRAAILAGYQGFAAGSAYPFTALQVIAPTGSAITTLGAKSRAAFLGGRYPALSRSASTRAVTLTFVPALNLYSSDPVVTNNAAVIRFYSDAAGTQSAGSMTMTLPASANGTTVYAAYPVQIPIVINLTAGNLPCTGNVVVAFGDQTGLNKMTGHLQMTKNKVDITLDLGLSGTLEVSGTITGVENGATVHLTNCRGNLFGTLTCDLTIDPYGWKGTATGSLVTGAFSTQVSTTSGPASSSVDANGVLKILYPDATVENITAPLTASLVTTSPGGTSTATYAAPINLGDIHPDAINSSGAIVAGEGINTNGRSLYLSAAGASPQILAPVQSNYLYALSIDNAGEIIGFNSTVGTYYYSSPTSTPTALPVGAASLNSSGEVIGYFNNLPVYRPSVSGAQVSLQTLSGYPSDFASGVSPNGQIVGNATNATASLPIYWSSVDPTLAPVALKDIAGARGTEPMFINDKGQIAGNTQINSVPAGVYWRSPTDQNPLALPLPAGGTPFANGSSVAGMNRSGQIIGTGKGLALLWQDGKVTDLNTLIPANSGWTLTSATAINDQGWILGIGTIKDTSGTLTTSAFLIKPK
ncbi:MAG: extracellular repeat protein family [Chthonomonadales bacterium]|nr:extracellular repeat protein family [Chthonomonadales bacterium]